MFPGLWNACSNVILATILSHKYLSKHVYSAVLAAFSMYNSVLFNYTFFSRRVPVVFLDLPDLTERREPG